MSLFASEDIPEFYTRLFDSDSDGTIDGYDDFVLIDDMDTLPDPPEDIGARKTRRRSETVSAGSKPKWHTLTHDSRLDLEVRNEG